MFRYLPILFFSSFIAASGFFYFVVLQSVTDTSPYRVLTDPAGQSVSAGISETLNELNEIVIILDKTGPPGSETDITEISDRITVLEELVNESISNETEWTEHYIGFFTLIFTGLGTIGSMYFAWRADRRALMSLSKQLKN